MRVGNEPHGSRYRDIGVADAIAEPIVADPGDTIGL
jgi:hypothetical protein